MPRLYSCQLMPSRSVSAIAADGPQVPGGIGPRRDARFRPGGADAVDPRPLRLDLVAADEQGRVALDQVEQQPLIGDPPAVFAEGIGEADIERDLAQPHALRGRGPGVLAIRMQADRLFRLEADDQLVRPGRRAARGEDRIRHVLELDEDLGVALGHALAGAQVEGHALPAPIVDVRLQRDEGLGRGCRGRSPRHSRAPARHRSRRAYTGR